MRPRHTRRAPETQRFLQLLGRLEQRCNGAWHVRLAGLTHERSGSLRTRMKATHQIGRLDAWRHVLASSSGHVLRYKGQTSGELRSVYTKHNTNLARGSFAKNVTVILNGNYDLLEIQFIRCSLVGTDMWRVHGRRRRPYPSPTDGSREMA